MKTQWQKETETERKMRLQQVQLRQAPLQQALRNLENETYIKRLAMRFLESETPEKPMKV
jgi:hypothetical protein